jgi:hypothetical protein
VSLTTSPVTVTAEVEVKRATMKGVKPPPTWVNGSDNKTVPIAIRAANV